MPRFNPNKPRAGLGVDRTRDVTASPDAPPNERPRPDLPASNLPGTDVADRLRFATRHAGVSAATAQVNQASSAATDAIVDALGSQLGKPLKRAVESSSGAARREADRGLEVLASHPIAPRVAVSLLSGRSLGAVRDRDVQLFTDPTVTGAELASAVAQFGRQHQVGRGLAGVHGGLSRILKDQLMRCPDPEKVQRALAAIDQHMKTNGDSLALVALLGDAGCLDDRWATDKTAVAGTDPLQVIIDRAADADGFSVINEAEVSGRRQALAASGLTETSSWQALSTLDNHRGAVGEALRMSDLAAEHPGKTLQQGVILARQPHGLDFVETKDQALDWCETFGVNPRKLSSWVDDGQRRFGIQVSEIDVCVFEEVSGALHPRVFENVKAGNGTAGTADKQNRRALEAIVEPDMKILFHEDGEAYRDRTADVARSADVIAEVQIATVGPLGDPTYDVSLPLTASDITELTHRLRGER